MGREEGNVFLPVSERCRFDGKDIQSVIQVASETAGRDLVLQVPVSRCNDPDISAPRSILAHSFVGFLLQDTQQFALHFQRDLTDLVQEQSSARRDLEATNPVPNRASKCPSGVAEEFALIQFRWDRSAINLNQGFVFSSAAPMNFACD